MPADRLQCLALRQPWAWAVCTGAKDIENRDWTTKHRGPLAIQASAARQEVNRLVKESKGRLNADEMVVGAIIGVVDLADITPLGEALESNPWATGPQCWKFANARLLEEPIAYKGALHLYELPADTSQRIREQLLRPARSRSNAAEAWLAAIQPDPFDMQAYRCMTYRDLQDLGGMNRAATEMVRLNPQSSDAHRLKAAAQFFAGDAPASIPNYAEAIRLNPTDANAHYLAALAYQAMGDQAQSEAHWKQAKELDPDTPELS